MEFVRKTKKNPRGGYPWDFQVPVVKPLYEPECTDYIWALHVGLDGHQPMTLETIKEVLEIYRPGITAEEVLIQFNKKHE